jgi:signal transduction histidine kinase
MNLAAFSSKLSTRHHLPIAILVLLATAIIGSSFYLIGRLLDANRWVDHFLEVHEEAQLALISMLNCETSMRGYLSTGEPSFLGPYNNSCKIVFVHLDNLKELTADNAQEAAMMPALFQLANAQIKFCQGVINWRQSHFGMPVSGDIKLHNGKQIMDKYRVATAAVLNSSHLLVVQQRQSVSALWVNVYSAVVLMSFCMIGALLWIARISTSTARIAEEECLRSSLLSCVSHDLRTPLAGITGAATSLMSSFDSMNPDTAKELLQSIYDEADRMNRLVGNLLDMTRLSSGTIAMKKDWMMIEEVIGAAISRLESRLRNHRVTVQLPADLPLIDADELLLQQLFINLLDNAAKYTPPGKQIKISGSKSANAVQIEIFNEGSSLASGEESKIFEKFYRGRNSGTVCGSGLGLPICYAIVDAHGGRIWVENKQGQGVAFVFSLPLRGEAPQVILDEPEYEKSEKVDSTASALA